MLLLAARRRTLQKWKIKWASWSSRISRLAQFSHWRRSRAASKLENCSITVCIHGFLISWRTCATRQKSDGVDACVTSVCNQLQTTWCEISSTNNHTYTRWIAWATANRWSLSCLFYRNWTFYVYSGKNSRFFFSLRNLVATKQENMCLLLTCYCYSWH